MADEGSPYILSPSSAGSAARSWPGGCRSLRRRRSASRPWRRRLAVMADRRSSTVSKPRNSRRSVLALIWFRRPSRIRPSSICLGNGRDGVPCWDGSGPLHDRTCQDDAKHISWHWTRTDHAVGSVAQDARTATASTSTPVRGDARPAHGQERHMTAADQSTTTPEHVPVFERDIDAPVASLWCCWTEPDLLRRSFRPGPWQVSEVRMDGGPRGENASLTPSSSSKSTLSAGWLPPMPSGPAGCPTASASWQPR